MPIFEPDLPFDESKPFYPLVVGYVIQLHGYIELSSRGLFSVIEGFDPKRVEALKTGQDEKFIKAVDAVSSGGITGLLGNQELHSKVTGQGVKIDISLLAKKAFWNHAAHLNDFMRMSSCSLVVLAYEVTKDYQTHDPLWEFFRHCRNAAAHKGHFNLLHGEPKRSAKWRSLEIVTSMQGMSLFFDGSASGLLGIGDTLHLLLDIEQSFPSIK